MREHKYNKANPRTSKLTLTLSAADRSLLRDAASAYGWGTVIGVIIAAISHLMQGGISDEAE